MRFSFCFTLSVMPRDGYKESTYTTLCSRMSNPIGQPPQFRSHHIEKRFKVGELTPEMIDSRGSKGLAGPRSPVQRSFVTLLKDEVDDFWNLKDAMHRIDEKPKEEARV